MCAAEQQPVEHSANQTDEKVFVTPVPKPGYEIVKRIFDVVMSIFALIVLSPLLLIVSLIILFDGGKPIFSQTRLTKGGKEFKMYKFRSMRLDAEEHLKEFMDQNEMEGPAFKIADDPRVTKFGKFLRRSSIDELPQLINIIKGDMSIVGPRPPLVWEVEQYTPYQMHRLDVKTGLSCYRECTGRSQIISFDEWVELDLKYIRERSFLTDLKIIFKTIGVVLTHKGAM